MDKIIIAILQKTEQSLRKMSNLSNVIPPGRHSQVFLILNSRFFPPPHYQPPRRGVRKWKRDCRRAKMNKLPF